MVDAEGPVEVAVLGLEQLSVVLVLDPDFLDVGVGETPDGTLHIQHTQETSALKNGQRTYRRRRIAMILWTFSMDCP